MQKHIVASVVAVSVLLMAIPAFAVDASPKPKPTPVPVADQISCVRKVVATREKALTSGVGAYGDAVKSAYNTRADALDHAYQLTTTKDVKAAVRMAWTAYSLAIKNAGKTWRSARQSAWHQYTKDVRACKAPGSISDSSHAGSEVMGQ